MTIDFRPFLANELYDPEVRREFVIACYEQNGMDGLRMAFDEIARAEAFSGTTVPMPKANSLADSQTLLNQMGLDLSLFRLSAMDRVLTAV